MQDNPIEPNPLVMRECHAQQLFDGITQLEKSSSASILDLIRLTGMDPAKDLANRYLRGYNLSGIDFSRVNLSGVDLSEANLEGADLSYTNLEKANLSKANLTDANLTGAKLTRTLMSYCDLTNTNVQDANFLGVDFSTVKIRVRSDLVERQSSEDQPFQMSEEEVKSDLRRRGALISAS